MVVYDGSIPYLHGLVDESSRIGCNEKIAAHKGANVGGECLVKNPVSLIVVDPPTPDDSPLPTNQSI
jgi:hypothetical protein